MGCTLENHSRQYSLNLCESLSFVISGLPYAKRHWELSHSCSSPQAWGHRIVAVIEIVPVIGSLAALSERVAVLVYKTAINPTVVNRTLTLPSHIELQPLITKNDNLAKKISIDIPTKESDEKQKKDLQPRDLSKEHTYLNILSIESSTDASIRESDDKQKKDCLSNMEKHIQWKPRELSIDEAMAKMWKNTKKAIEEHIKNDPVGIYLTAEQAIPAKTDLTPKPPLSFTHSIYENIGYRKEMEDALFIKEIEQGLIFGIFDGHGGSNVSKRACKIISAQLPKELDLAKGNISYAFDKIIDDTQKAIEKHPEWNYMGSTAVISFIDKSTHIIYTATLGDSEVNTYKNGKSTPLSCIRDWSSEKDRYRANRFGGLINPHDKDPKLIRFGQTKLNVARAFGDAISNPGVSHKAKKTIGIVTKGSIVTAACDGVKDFLTESEISKITFKNHRQKDLAKTIGIKALEQMRRYDSDNISVIAIIVD